MAEVYRAKTFGAAGFERIVAIKLLLPNVAMDQDFVTMLIDEAKIAGQLSHANIAQIFDLGSVEGRYYIVQEYVNGMDLRKILRRLARSKRKLSVAQATHIILKACEGLEYAHNKRDPSGNPLNLVHRDVSPQNIIVSNEGEVKLVDFGIAKAEGRATRTLAGLVKGKFAYMSPEQIRGLPVDRRSDVFATGIVLHELLTSKPLFRRKSEFETLKRARSGKIDPPSKLNPDVPPELDAIALTALARHVEDRYPNAVEFRDALWQFARNSGNFYSRNHLAAWMAAEIEEESASAELDGDFPLIEPENETDSHPTVVDLSDQDRDSAELSGEVRSSPGRGREEVAVEASVELSAEVLAAAAVMSESGLVPHLQDPGTIPLSAETEAMLRSAANRKSQRLTAPFLGAPFGADPALASAENKRTLVAMSAPMASVGARHPEAPVATSAQVMAKGSDAAASAPASAAVAQMGRFPSASGQAPRISYRSPAEFPSSSEPGFDGRAALGTPVGNGIGVAQFYGPPPALESTSVTIEPVKSGRGSVLIFLAILVLIGAVGISISLAMGVI